MCPALSPDARARMARHAATGAHGLGLSGRKVRVLIADDHPAVREALSRCLRAEPDLDVIGLARDGVEAVALAAKLRPQVVIMDANMQRLSGIEATHRLKARFPEMRILGFSVDFCGHWAAALRSAGAAVCVDKAGGIEPVLAAIRMGKPAWRNGFEVH